MPAGGVFVRLAVARSNLKKHSEDYPAKVGAYGRSPVRECRGCHLVALHPGSNCDGALVHLVRGDRRVPATSCQGAFKAVSR